MFISTLAIMQLCIARTLLFYQHWSIMRQKCFVGETNPILYRNDSINIDGTFFSQAFFLGVHFLSCHRFMHRSKRHQKTTNKINHRKLCCAITTTNVAIFLPLLFICQPTDQKYTQNNCLFSRFAEDAKRETCYS